MKKISITFSIFALGLLFFPKTSLGGNQNVPKGFSLNPFYQEITLNEGIDKVPFSIDVTNNTTQATVFRISVLDFGALDETGGVAFLGSADNLKYSLSSWVDLQNDTLVLNAGETQAIKGSVLNKDSLSPGGHYGAIFLKNEDSLDPNNQKQNIAFDPSFASLLFVRKTGGEISSLNLNNKDFSHGLFSLPGVVNLKFQNMGNVHVIPRGTIKITDPFGTDVQKGIINEQSSIILPETLRIFPTKITAVAAAFVPGRYTLTVRYRFDSKDDFVTDISNFIYVPKLFIFSLFLVILILTVLFFLLHKRKNAAAAKR